MDRKKISGENFLINFFGLYDSLKTLFKREVDLIKYKAIHNPYFLAELDETKIVLYDKSREEISVWYFVTGNLQKLKEEVDTLLGD